VLNGEENSALLINSGMECLSQLALFGMYISVYNVKAVTRHSIARSIYSSNHHFFTTLSVLLGSKNVFVKQRCIETLASISSSDAFKVAVDVLLRRFDQILPSTEWYLRRAAVTAIKTIAETCESFTDMIEKCH
jgi:hypothetical protein